MYFRVFLGRISKVLDFSLGDYGTEAGKMLIRQINGGGNQKPVLIKQELIDPESI